jgi:acyl dehydratase
LGVDHSTRVNTFTDATDDHQRIHVDVERAKAESPFGVPIGHGYLTLSLPVPLLNQILTVTDATMAVNYGLNKVRFPAPVPVGSTIRLAATLNSAKEIEGGVQAVLDARIEREGGDTPACVAEPVFRFFG